MSPLSPRQLVDAWDAGLALGEVGRPLPLLQAATPEVAWWQAPIGRRDAALLDLRVATWGARMECRAACPACSEQVELDVDLRELRLPDAEDDGGWRPIGLGDWEARVPTSEDLAVALAAPSRGREQLLGRCVRSASGAARTAEVEALAAAELARRDPQAELRFDLECPACGARWTAPFDIGAAVWRELDAEAGRLLDEVSALARGFGWREAEILEMSASRRRAYLDRLEAQG